MKIRRAEEKDAERVEELLRQVLMIHADIRPDLFIPGTAKYTREELLRLFADDMTPVFTAVNDSDAVMGYVFCRILEPVRSNNMTARRGIYIDDLCVSEECRGMHIGRQLYEYVLAYAKQLGWYHVTLNVWEGNDSARKFYESMGMKPQKTTMEVIL